MIADVAVSAVSYGADKRYSYRVPENLEGVVRGARVWIPFGKGNRRCEGIVLSVKEGSGDGLKPVESVMDAEPLYNEERLGMAAFLRERCFCTFFEAARVLLPTEFWYRQELRYEPTELSAAWEETKKMRAGRPRRMLETLCRAARPLTLREWLEEAGPDGEKTAVRTLVKKGLVREVERISGGPGNRAERRLRLLLPPEEAKACLLEKRDRPIHHAVLDALAAEPEMSVRALRYQTGVQLGVLHTMEKWGLLQQFDREERPPFSLPEEKKDGEPLPPLTPVQADCARGLLELFEKKEPTAALLWGVTGSGKTRVYMELISRCISEGKSALLLVPEISLTPQLSSMFLSAFGRRVAVMHSALSPRERRDEWLRICSGEADLVVGTRSAVFAPVENPGLIVIDEEQERTYRSEETPRYNAVEVAKYRCARTGGLLILGSATPSVESFTRAKEGSYTLFQMRERYEGTQLPEVIVADMRGRSAQEEEVIGPTLASEIRRSLEDGEQSILFLNRRGTSRLVACAECGYVPQCIRCSGPLAYHAANDRLMCHYCGYSVAMPEVCPVCGGHHLLRRKAGTQKVEEELRRRFPDARVIRMDADTTGGRQGHARLLNEVYTGNADILVGTQMVAKGLDFEKVSLVGVVDADLSLYSGDYRAAERTFSLLTQVIGRAGRRKKRGRAVIQTFTPENPVILSAAAQDYEEFYEREMEMRRALKAPPLTDFVTFTLTGEQEVRVLDAAMRLSQRLRGLMRGEFSDLKEDILGPTPAVVLRVNRRYRYHVYFRSCANHRLRRLISGVLAEFLGEKANKGVSLFAEINGDAY